MTSEYIYVHSDAELATHLKRWSQCDWLALDTEFLREDTYFPKLALIQVSDGGVPVCVDVQTVDSAPLVALLRNPDLLKVFHSASQDLEVLTTLAGECPAPLFDTQVAAALLGEAEQMGYAALVEKRLGVKLGKEFTRLDWTRRPLPEGALRYAADDVRYLAALYPALRDALAARGRLDWLIEDCARQAQTARYQPNPGAAWQRLKGLARLDIAAQHRAARLAAWREKTAVERNRPRRWIAEDELLYALATRCPRTPDELRALSPTPKQMERYAAIWLELLNAPVIETTPLKSETGWSGAQKNLIGNLSARIQAKAGELGVGAPLLATRSDIEALVRGETSELLLGWRREVIGGELLKTVRGE
ncbi:MAG: ribonuclease D [Pseudomonadota bacterium]